MLAGRNGGLCYRTKLYCPHALAGDNYCIQIKCQRLTQSLLLLENTTGTHTPHTLI